MFVYVVFLCFFLFVDLKMETDTLLRMYSATRSFLFCLNEWKQEQDVLCIVWMTGHLNIWGKIRNF